MPDEAHRPPPSADAPPGDDAPAAKSGGGMFKLLLVLALGGGGWWAYSAGHMDAYLPSSLRAQAPSVPSLPADAERPSAPAAPAQRLDRDDDDDAFDGLVVQLEGIEARIDSNERNLLQYSAVLERIADEIAINPATGEPGSGPAPFAVARLQIELIDVRLRMTGDTARADTELAALAEGLDPQSALASLIAENRRLLAATPSRSSLLAMLEDIKRAAQEVAAEAERAAAASDTSNQAPGMLARLFKVSDAQPADRPEIVLASQAEAATNACIQALALGLSAEYGRELGKLSALARDISEHAPSAYAVRLAQAVAELAAIGFPSYELRTENPG